MRFNKALYRPPSGNGTAPEGEGVEEKKKKKEGKIVNHCSDFLMANPHEEVLSLGMEKAELRQGILVDTI